VTGFAVVIAAQVCSIITTYYLQRQTYILMVQHSSLTCHMRVFCM